MSGDDRLCQVRLLQLPVDVWARAREHSGALQREFALITSGQLSGETSVKGTPVRLLEVMATIQAQYAGVGSAQEEQMFAAEAAGQVRIDELVYEVPAHSAGAARQLETIFDDADVYCRAGQHLLTLETPTEALLYRRWFLGEFTRQIEGQPPTAWPQFLAAQPTSPTTPDRGDRLT